MKTQELKSIMSRAWQLKRQYDVMYSGGVLFGECLKMAWGETYKTQKIVELMRVGVVWFEFLKVDGTIRRACGTLLQSLIPEEQWPTGESRRRQNDSVQVFFDLEKQEWRCFKKLNVLRILTENDF